MLKKFVLSTNEIVEIRFFKLILTYINNMSRYVDIMSISILYTKKTNLKANTWLYINCS